MANINGWGRGTWGQLTFGEALPVTLTAPGAGTSALGTVAVDAEANVVPASLVGTTGAPVAGVNAQAVASIEGAVGTVGSLSVAVDGEAIVTLTGSGTVGTSALGTATLITNNNLSVTLNTATGSLGTVTTVSEANVAVIGVQSVGSVGQVLVWSLIDDTQTKNYANINTDQSSSFAENSETQNPNWEEVA